MGGLNVKNTIVEWVLQIIAPHPCYGCGKVGAILCDNCKYDIINEPFVGCFLCGIPQNDGICQEHASPLEKVMIVSRRGGSLEEVINALKFSNVKAGAKVLAELLDVSLPLLPQNTRIVPIPTVRAHIRQRGYDQVELIARQFAVMRGYSLSLALRRETKTTQHTSDRETRQKQAAVAFSLDEAALGDGPILLLDDIITTGSTISAAAELFRGSERMVMAAALAYQPLD